MLTRLEAIQDIRLGRGIQLSFVGHVHADGRVSQFNVILRRNRRGGCDALIDCQVMLRTYIIRDLTGRQVLAYIKRHYDRHDSGEAETHITLREIPVVPMVAA